MIKHPGVVVAHACKPSPGQAEGGGGLPGSSKPARAAEEHLFLKSQSKANTTKNPNDSQAHGGNTYARSLWGTSTEEGHLENGVIWRGWPSGVGTVLGRECVIGSAMSTVYLWLYPGHLQGSWEE